MAHVGAVQPEALPTPASGRQHATTAAYEDKARTAAGTLTARQQLRPQRAGRRACA